MSLMVFKYSFSNKPPATKANVDLVIARMSDPATSPALLEIGARTLEVIFEQGYVPTVQQLDAIAHFRDTVKAAFTKGSSVNKVVTGQVGSQELPIVAYHLLLPDDNPENGPSVRTFVEHDGDGFVDGPDLGRTREYLNVPRLSSDADTPAHTALALIKDAAPYMGRSFL